jgi:hypothetical protein
MSRPAETARPLLLRWLHAFGLFWWDFLIGDTPELTAATLVIIGITVALAKVVSTTAAWATLPALVILALALSVKRGRTRS